MTNSFEERYRQLLEMEDGEPISAGARVSHVRTAIESGRGVYVDLSSVAEEKRAALLDEIQALVARYSPVAH
ncbi:hypothetical protein FRUB_09964 [Fimbriiglobus ruber]|uniref:Uncharacterized protein n=1 Tax=Fimbriiglobus ruber TaxID=1908690 RepID=A0A225D0U6_9BACT|nr:hypothetical protein FRUB_09964 [Fimbriiglobus ruber]